MAPPDWVIERLAKKHDRTAFCCGQPTLDDWLRLRVSQFEKRDLARTYVAVRSGASAVLGYYAISNHRVTFAALSPKQAKGLPPIDIPVVLLGRLAVDQSVQGQGLGELLLVDALRRAQHIAEQIGVRAVKVDAIDDKAQAFYRKFGFAPLLDNPSHLFLPIQLVRKLNLPALG